jgi:Tfp pilus assembly protein PilN
MLALGVDLGDEAISLALLETGARAPRLIGSWRELREPGETTAEALRRVLAARCPTPPEAVASALPGRQATFRLLRLPFSDQSRLAATVPYELESAVPFDLASTVVAFTAVERSAAGTSVFAVIAPREHVLAHLADLRSAGVDPAVVDLGALALAGLFERPAADLLLVEAHEDGGVALLRSGHLAGLRVLDTGRHDGPEALLAQARWSALTLAGETPPPALVLIGPGSERARPLAAALGVPLASAEQHLPAWAGSAPSEHLRAVALAARAAGVTRLGVNLRVGDLAYHAPSEESRRHLRTTIAVAVATAAIAAVFLTTAVVQRRAELQALRDQIAASVRGVLPNPVAGTERAQLEAAIETMAHRRATLAGGSAERPPVLELLRSIAEAVPTGTSLEIQDLTVEPEGVRIHARTDSFESVDVLKRALQAIPGTEDAQVKDVKAGIDGRVEFRASLGFADGGGA